MTRLQCTCWLLFAVSPTLLFAQFYIDASGNLPDNGATRANMDVQAADLDADGDLDIVLANEFQPNHNSGSGPSRLRRDERRFGLAAFGRDVSTSGVRLSH